MFDLTSDQHQNCDFQLILPRVNARSEEAWAGQRYLPDAAVAIVVAEDATDAAVGIVAAVVEFDAAAIDVAVVDDNLLNTNHDGILPSSYSRMLSRSEFHVERCWPYLNVILVGWMLA